MALVRSFDVREFNTQSDFSKLDPPVLCTLQRESVGHCFPVIDMGGRVSVSNCGNLLQLYVQRSYQPRERDKTREFLGRIHRASCLFQYHNHRYAARRPSVHSC